MEAALGRRGRRLLLLLLPLTAALQLGPSAALPLGQVPEGRRGGSWEPPTPVDEEEAGGVAGAAGVEGAVSAVSSRRRAGRAQVRCLQTSSRCVPAFRAEVCGKRRKRTALRVCHKLGDCVPAASCLPSVIHPYSV